MLTIHKFPLQQVGGQVVQMPKGAKILHVHEQTGWPCIWAEVDTEAEIEDVPVWVLGTGQELPKFGQRKYLGTAHCRGFVWHVYQLA